MCLSRSGVRSHQRFQPRVEDERRDRVDELHLEHLDGRDLIEQQPPGVAAAQIDLLQILIEPACREQRRPATRALRRAAAPATASARARGLARRIDRTRRGAYRAVLGHPLQCSRLSFHHVRVERRRPPDGLTRVVDDEVERDRASSASRGRRPRRSACAAGRGRRFRADRPTRRNRASREYRDAASRGKRVVTITCAPERSSLRPA